MSLDGPEVRIGDAERDAAVAALGEHFAVGRLTKDEYDERAAEAWSARTASAIRPLFADLPATQPAASQQAVAAPRTVTPAGPASAPASTGGRRFPLLQVFLIVLAAVMVFGLAWPAFLVLGGLWWAAMSFRWQRNGSAHHTGWGPGCGTR